MTQPITPNLNAQKSEEVSAPKVSLNFFPVPFAGSASRFIAGRPRTFSLLGGAFSFITGLSLLKITDIFSRHTGNKNLRKEPSLLTSWAKNLTEPNESTPLNPLKKEAEVNTVAPKLAPDASKLTDIVEKTTPKKLQIEAETKPAIQEIPAVPKTASFTKPSIRTWADRREQLMRDKV